MKIDGKVAVSRTVTLTLSLTDDEIALFGDGCAALAEPEAVAGRATARAVAWNPKARTLFAAIHEGLRRAMQ